MKILSCVAYGYYGRIGGASYEYLSFVDCLRQMGHEVHHFDYRQAAGINKEAMNAFLLNLARSGGYDLILIITKQDEILFEILDEMKRHTVTVAWNCDDDWRWESYSKKYAPHYTFMVTTYKDIYASNKVKCPNLLLSQWACTGINHYDEIIAKDIPFSFVGYCYGEREAYIKRLRRRMGLAAWGRDVPSQPSFTEVLQKRFAHLMGIPWTINNLELPGQRDVASIWKRSKISLTPLEASQGGGKQIKGRVFEMGLTGTMMLASNNPELHEFYEPGTEYVEYSSLEECEEKARYYLANDVKRQKIVYAYRKRTESDHMWTYRFSRLFNELGFHRG